MRYPWVYWCSCWCSQSLSNSIWAPTPALRPQIAGGLPKKPIRWSLPAFSVRKRPRRKRLIKQPRKLTPGVNPDRGGRRLAIWIEWCFGAAIVLAIFGLVRDVLVGGYLPDPFLHAKADTFMDWYNPA